jgi:hypothetical protein
VPLADDPEHAGSRVLLDDSGGEIARFRQVEREKRVADLFTLADGVEPERAAGVVMAELAGWRIAAEEPFGRLLVAAGGRPHRRSHAMSRDLVRDPAPSGWLEPPLPAGVRLTDVDRPAIELAPACHAAYPREHPDYSDEAPEVELEEIMSGRLMGPLLRCSGLAVGEDGTVLGAVLITGTSGAPPTGGPWIAQLFRRPDVPGLGGPLLRRALALATRDGLPAVGLAVTHGNPALGLYEAHGFAEVLDSLSIAL